LKQILQLPCRKQPQIYSRRRSIVHNVKAPLEFQVSVEQKSGRTENYETDFTGMMENYLMSEEGFPSS